MAWRGVFIQNPARLRLQNSQLQVEQDSGTGSVPLEDVTVIVLDCPNITLTSSLMAATQHYGIVVVCCDERHMPNGVLLPFHQHSRQAEVTALQQNWGKPFCKRAWQSIVQQKIRNQSLCLEATTKDGAQHLAAMAKRVGSGDPENIEAQAARYYFPKIYGQSFRRQSPCWINSALNYGYAIVRAVVARSIVAHGLIPSWGLHHGNNLNAFNLADDLMEVVRPMVDAHVWRMPKPDDGELSKQDRASLVAISHMNCHLAGETHTLTNAVDKMAASLVASSRGEAASLELPVFA